MTKKKSTATATLPGVEIPGYDKELTALALEVVSAKEDTKKAREAEDIALDELLQAMKERQLKKYHDADAKVRIELSRSKETVKVLKDKPPKPALKGAISRDGRL